jgi:hypothetical protein
MTSAGMVPVSTAQRLDSFKIDQLVAETYFDSSWTKGPVVLARDTHAVNGERNFHAPVGLPVAPDPSLRVLEPDTSVTASFVGSGVDVAVSSIFPGNGQHVNFLPSAIGSGMMESTAFSGNAALAGPATGFYPSSMGLAQAVLGAFPIGSSTEENLIQATQLEIWDLASPPVKKRSINTVYGYFNEVSSMDASGFVNMIMSGSPGTTTGYAMSSSASGLCVSGGHAPITLDTFGTVEYSVRLSKGDLQTVALYGGIYHLGLWTIDMKQSLLNGNTPPFAFSVLNNPRKYKLFARKGLTKDLCYTEDDGGSSGFYGYEDLTIKWRLHFV